MRAVIIAGVLSVPLLSLSSAARIAPGQEWHGTFGCGDVTARATLIFVEVTQQGPDNAQLVARLSYAGPSIRGSHTFRGTLKGSTGGIELSPASPGFTPGPSAIAGNVSEDGRSLDAKVTHSRCTTLALRTDAPVDTSAAATSSTNDWVSAPPRVLELPPADRTKYLALVSSMTRAQFNSLPKSVACAHSSNMVVLTDEFIRQGTSVFNSTLAALRTDSRVEPEVRSRVETDAKALLGASDERNWERFRDALGNSVGWEHQYRQRLLAAQTVVRESSAARPLRQAEHAMLGCPQ